MWTELSIFAGRRIANYRNMEKLDLFDCSNVLITSYFTDDRGCAHENREHTLIYICSGLLEIEERGKKVFLRADDCAFMRRDTSYTGRSLATFKRDFAKISDLSPRKWLIRRRLEAAHQLIQSGKKKVTDICYAVGFKNLSHFSKVYKEMYGTSPVNGC